MSGNKSKLSNEVQNSVLDFPLGKILESWGLTFNIESPFKFHELSWRNNPPICCFFMSKKILKNPVWHCQADKKSGEKQ